MADDIKLFAVVGNPISHSISPKIHNDWIAKHGLKAFYSPLLIQNEADFCKVIPLLPKLGFCGINITVPFKQTAFSICDEIDDSAANIKAVNCIKFSNGNLIGYNTDCFGFAEPLKLIAKNNNLHIKKAIVIGGGGASRAVIQALIDDDIKIDIYNRTQSKLDEILADFTSKQTTTSLVRRFAQNFKGKQNLRQLECTKNMIQKPNITIISGNLNEINLEEYDLIVNATSVGLKDNDLLEINYKTINKNAICYDLIYKKTSLTPFLQEVQNFGVKYIIDGTQMLHLQAAKSFEIWHGFMP